MKMKKIDPLTYHIDLTKIGGDIPPTVMQWQVKPFTEFLIALRKHTITVSQHDSDAWNHAIFDAAIKAHLHTVHMLFNKGLTLAKVAEWLRSNAFKTEDELANIHRLRTGYDHDQYVEELLESCPDIVKRVKAEMAYNLNNPHKKTNRNSLHEDQKKTRRHFKVRHQEKGNFGEALDNADNGSKGRRSRPSAKGKKRSPDGDRSRHNRKVKGASAGRSTAVHS